MPVIDTEGKWKYNSNPFATSALEGVAWSALQPGLFTPEKDSASILQDAGWSLGPSARKTGLKGIRFRTVQPVANRYTEYVIPVEKYCI